MRKSLFVKILQKIEANNEYFVQKPDSTDLMEASEFSKDDSCIESTGVHSTHFQSVESYL